jgi:hypothetical protein
MEAQAYFDNLKSQGFDDEFAQKHTRQYYPDFSLNPTASVGNVGNHNAWISQNFQRIAAECYPDDEGAVFTIADIRNNGQVIEVVAHSNPSIGYDPVRYDFIIINGIPALESTSTPNPDGSWSPFFSTGVSSTPAPTAHIPVVHQTHPPQQQQQQYPPQQQQMGQYAAQQQPMMQGQPMQALAQNSYAMGPPSTNALLALTLSIIGIIGCFFYGFGICFAIPGLILANGALKITDQFPNHPDAGIAKAAKICAWIAISLIIVVGGLVVLAGVLYVWAASLA